MNVTAPRVLKSLVACSAGLLLAEPARADTAPTATPTPTPSYPLSAYSSFGSSLALSGHFAELGWSDEQVSAFLQGFKVAIQGKPVPMDGPAAQLITDMNKRMSEIASAAQLRAAKAEDPSVRLKTYFSKMGKRLGLQVSDDGLGFKVESGRNGVRPRPGDTVVFTVRATQADGATEIPLLSAAHLKVKFAGMMPALMEGLQMMSVGSHAVFVIPPALSFGDGQWPDGVTQGSPLVYWVSLEDVVAAPVP